jgi:hypothetical protein
VEHNVCDVAVSQEDVAARAGDEGMTSRAAAKDATVNNAVVAPKTFRAKGECAGPLSGNSFL